MERILSLMAIVTSFSAMAQTGFQNVYGTQGSQFGLSCQQTSDGGFVFFGQSNLGMGVQHMYMVRTDAWGGELWTRTYETSTFDFGTSVKQMYDEGFVITGSIGFDEDSLTVIRTDPQGEIIWQRNFSGWGRSVGQHVLVTNDGDILVTGFTGGGEQEDVMLVRLTPAGELVWINIHDRPGRQFTRRLVETSDGGFAYFGTTGGFYGDMLLVRTDANGDTLWTKIIGTDISEQGMSIANATDGFILLGHQYLPGGDLILMRTDANGEIQWTEFHGGDGWDLAADVVVTPDGAFAIAGRKETENGHHMYFIRTDPSGGSVWENTYPFNEMSDALELQMTVDGGYIMLGSSTMLEPLSSKFYGVKIDANGYVGVEDRETHYSILAFPNPFTDQTWIDLRGHGHSENTLVLIDMLGDLIRTYDNAGTGGFMLDRQDLAAGMYLLKWKSEGDLSVPLKLIAQ